MSTFIWLASYPKSGNTWVRAFLSSVAQDGAPVDINRMSTPQPSTRHVLDDLLGVPTSDLTNKEILQARPAALRAYAARQKEPLISKVHEAWQKTSAGQPLFPTELTKASVYIVRDPRDVAVSFAHHLGKSIEHVITLMADPEAALSGSIDKLNTNTQQPLLSWSQHVESWLDLASPSPLLVRYEDMLADPLGQGILMAKHVGLHKETSVYEQAVQHTSFSALSQQESAGGFRETLAHGRRFFRSGRSGAWKETLSLEQIATIEKNHGSVMARLGYL